MSFPPSLRSLWTAMLSASLFTLTSMGIAAAQEPAPAPSVTPSTPSPATSPSPDRWRFGITPYIWVPTANGSFQFFHPSLPLGSVTESVVGVRVGPNSYLSKLNSAVELLVDAEKSESFVFGDVIYINASNTGASVVDLGGPLGHIHLPINVDTSLRFTTTLATGGIGGYFLHTSGASAGAFVGLRYLNIDATTSWNLTGPLGGFAPTGSAEEKRSDLYGIAGLRGRIQLGHGWYIPFYGDYGGSGEITTWQAIGGIGHAYPTGAVSLVWRQLSHIANSGTNTNLQSLHLGGPAFAWTFNL